MSAWCLLPPNPATGMSAGSSTVMASVARAEQRAALVAAGGVPSARRGRRGGPSQQLHLIRIDRVDNFVMNVYGRRSRSRSRSRGRSRGTGGGVPLLLPRPRPKARPLNVFVRHAAPVAARAVQTPLTPPSSPPPLPARELPQPPPRPVRLVPAAAAPQRTMPWPERVLQIFQRAGVSQDAYEPFGVEVR